jgi:disulfide bond formation protein DsbB
LHRAYGRATKVTGTNDMTLTRQSLTMLAMFGSVALLAGAFAFQYIGGLAPCQLCLWQRWPHAAAILIGLVALTTGWRGLAWLGALAALATAGIGAFHVGVEQLWWEGLATCTAGSIDGISTADLLNPEVDVAAPVRCDEIAWSLVGISMAGWNVIASLGFATIWVMAARSQN